MQRPQEGHSSDAGWNLSSKLVVVQVRIHEVRHCADAFWKVSNNFNSNCVEVLQVLESAELVWESRKHPVPIQSESFQLGEALYLGWDLTKEPKASQVQLYHEVVSLAGDSWKLAYELRMVFLELPLLVPELSSSCFVEDMKSFLLCYVALVQGCYEYKHWKRWSLALRQESGKQVTSSASSTTASPAWRLRLPPRTRFPSPSASSPCSLAGLSSDLESFLESSSIRTEMRRTQPGVFSFPPSSRRVWALEFSV